MQTDQQCRVTDIHVPFGSVFKLVAQVYAATILLGLIIGGVLLIFVEVFRFHIF